MRIGSSLVERVRGDIDVVCTRAICVRNWQNVLHQTSCMEKGGGEDKKGKARREL